MKEYVVTFKVNQQVSPDDFQFFNPSLKVTPETTIGEIVNWHKQYNAGSLEVKIIELLTLTP